MCDEGEWRRVGGAVYDKCTRATTVGALFGRHVDLACAGRVIPAATALGANTPSGASSSPREQSSLVSADNFLPSTSTMALPTKGRVIVDTTAGEIDIELWSKVRRIRQE